MIDAGERSIGGVSAGWWQTLEPETLILNLLL